MSATAAVTHAPTAHAARTANTAWIRSPWWDVYWMFSGLWAPLIALAVYTALFGVPTQAPAFHTQHFVLLFTALAVLHRLSSIHAVMLSPILRQEVRANPRRYVLVPLAIVLLTTLLAEAFTFHPVFAAFGSAQLWAFFVLGISLLLWDRWHFCMQEFGVLSLYRARAGQSARRDRRFDRVYVVLLMLLINSLLYVRAGFADDLHVLWRGSGIDRLYGQPVLEQLARALTILAGLLLSLAVLRELRHDKRSWPKLWYYVLIGSHSLVLYALPNALSLFFLSYVFHHWMVAVGLFNRVTLNAHASSSRRQRAWHYLAKVGPWFLVFVGASLFLGPLDLTAKLTPLPAADAFAGASSAARFLAGLAIGFFFSFSFLHYYYDRCLYSFSVPGVRRAIGPLLFAQDREQARVTER